MYIDAKGRKWFKGNIHAHSTLTDGHHTPEELAEIYRAHGYDFLSITDHWKVSETKEENGILLIAGCEYNTGADVCEGIFHITSLGCTETPVLDRSADAKTIVDEIHRCGGIANLAHPAWSMNTCEQLLPEFDGEVLPLFGADVTEIFNSVSDFPFNCRPYSGVVLDQLAARGYLPRLVATDDVHRRADFNLCRSYIWVQADEWSCEAIMEAIRAGRFYASQGPTLEVTETEDQLIVECSPVNLIACFNDLVWCGHRCEEGEGITKAVFDKGAATMARIEVFDAQGRSAWSQYFALNK